MDLTETGNGFTREQAAGDAARHVVEKHPRLIALVLMDDGTHMFTDTDGLQHWSFKFHIEIGEPNEQG